MKIIVSRKGFDGASGRVPSPIFADDTMLSLPIPYASGIPYAQINSPIAGSRCLSEIVEQLAPTGERCAHLDPDLDARSIARQEGWRGIFGQNSAAQTHLDNNLVGPGDIFLFFGLFRRVKSDASGRLRFVAYEPRKHVFFGWLKVAKKYRLPHKKDPTADPPPLPNWAKYHPHVKHPELERAPNTIFTATCHLGSDPEVCKAHSGAERCSSKVEGHTPGWGIFRRYSDELCLTHPIALRDAAGKLRDLPTRWRVPAWMHPRSLQGTNAYRTCLTYHNDITRWTERGGEHVTLKSVARGQEFVLDADQYPEARSWAEHLIESNNSFDGGPHHST